MNKHYKYKAFISYRHLQPDKEVAILLQNRLEKSLRRANKKHWKVFRDESELPTSNNLSEDINDALENSEYLIVICSPNLKQSKWCLQEIKRFKELHNGTTENILTLLVDGEANEAFPDDLIYTKRLKDGVLKDIETEPLAANIVASTKKERNKRFKTEYLRILAPLMGVEFDDLYNRERRRQMVAFMTVGGSIATVITAASVLFAVYNSHMRSLINEQLKLTEFENSKYLEQLKKTEEERENALRQYGDTINEQAMQYVKDGNLWDAINTELKAFELNDERVPYSSKSTKILADAIGAYDSECLIPVRRFEHKKNVNTMYFLMNATRLLSVDFGGNAYLWNVETGELIAEFDGENIYSSAYVYRDIYINDVRVLKKSATLSYINSYLSDYIGRENLEVEEYLYDNNSFGIEIKENDKSYLCTIDAADGCIIKKEEMKTGKLPPKYEEGFSYEIMYAKDTGFSSDILIDDYMDSIVLTNPDTGDKIAEWSFISGVVDYACSQDGTIYVTLGDGTIYVVMKDPLSIIDGANDLDINRNVIHSSTSEKLPSDLSESKYCKGIYAIAQNKSPYVDIYKHTYSKGNELYRTKWTEGIVSNIQAGFPEYINEVDIDYDNNHIIINNTILDFKGNFIAEIEDTESEKPKDVTVFIEDEYAESGINFDDILPGVEIHGYRKSGDKTYVIDDRLRVHVISSKNTVEDIIELVADDTDEVTDSRDTIIGRFDITEVDDETIIMSVGSRNRAWVIDRKQNTVKYYIPNFYNYNYKTGELLVGNRNYTKVFSYPLYTDKELYDYAVKLINR